MLQSTDSYCSEYPGFILFCKYKKMKLQTGAKLSGWQLIKKLLKLVWPEGNWVIRRRVILAMIFLIGAKVRNVIYYDFFFI